ncbi:hypothetical protein P872_07755 [Rhodonellum psychrophilum GCM71 = DSM 17998]|uniref:Long-chain fatty acid transporter n=2 Tax=Rhodonellum TaxID=336827 RepID=U5C0W1_9BACT|nr:MULTISPECIES: DUF2490 domain-containing protein [Rhodonellum]ERM81807.1 hypothetical protein P872_07755 [Rhodonellum psychrophilum GCM71 = DSM 17998]SDZ28016.1 Protein of unknown function [Rhodonellum ikkaensis]
MKIVKINSFIILLALFFMGLSVQAQNNRLHDYNPVGWYAFFANYKLDDKWSLHGEFQWRREGFFPDPQQNLYRVGVNYAIHKQVVFRLGYAFADTYFYGNIPIQASAKIFPEHRTYQMVTISNPIGRVALSHRFMLEQRWVGRYVNPNLSKVDDYNFVNRIRYMARIQIPLVGPTLEDKEPYLAAYDEVMIGFGKYVNQNIFDQNRIGLLAGYQFSKSLRIEGGYLNQTAQFGRLIDGKSVFQHNTGFIVNTYFSF